VKTMGLILQALAIIVAGIALAVCLGGFLSPLKRAPLSGVGLAVAVVAGVLFFVNVYKTGNALSQSTQLMSETNLFEAEHDGDPGANNEFLEWARNAMLAGDHGKSGGTYYLEPTTILGSAELGQWSTYALLPERATATPAEADWIVFYGVPLTLTAQEQGHFGDIAEFASGYGLATRVHAG
jgi:hypothetical protein